MEIDRRELLAQLAALMAGISAAACKRDPAAPDAAAPDATVLKPVAPARAFLPPQRAVIAAAVARILPTDHEPGAKEANVIEYLDLELARPEHNNLKTKVLAGITALGRLAQRGGNKLFLDLSPAEQDEVLHQVQNGSDRGKDFVFILTVLTLEGFFGDPRWGGNAGGSGWKLSGYGPGTGHHDH